MQLTGELEASAKAGGSMGKGAKEKKERKQMRTIMRSGLGALEEAGITGIFYICSTGIVWPCGCKSLSDAVFYELLTLGQRQSEEMAFCPFYR